jgi:hypothetical protein
MFISFPSTEHLGGAIALILLVVLFLALDKPPYK